MACIFCFSPKSHHCLPASIHTQLQHEIAILSISAVNEKESINRKYFNVNSCEKKSEKIRNFPLHYIYTCKKRKKQARKLLIASQAGRQAWQTDSQPASQTTNHSVYLQLPPFFVVSFPFRGFFHISFNLPDFSLSLTRPAKYYLNHNDWQLLFSKCRKSPLCFGLRMV